MLFVPSGSGPFVEANGCLPWKFLELLSKEKGERMQSGSGFIVIVIIIAAFIYLTTGKIFSDEERHSVSRRIWNIYCILCAWLAFPMGLALYLFGKPAEVFSTYHSFGFFRLAFLWEPLRF